MEHTHSLPVKIYVDATLKSKDRGFYDSVFKKLDKFSPISLDFEHANDLTEGYFILAQKYNLSRLSKQIKDDSQFFIYESYHPELPLADLYQDQGIYKISEESLSALKDSIESALTAKESKLLNETLTNSLENLKKLRKKSKRYHKYLDEKLDTLRNKTTEVGIISELNKLEETSLGFLENESVRELLKEFSKTYGIMNFDFMTEERILTQEETRIYLPVIIKGNLFEYIAFESIDEDIQAFVALNLLKIYYQFIDRNGLFHRFDEGEIWEKVFNNIKNPVALFSEKGDLIRHNIQFINLSLTAKECLAMVDAQSINLPLNTYKVYRREIVYNHIKTYLYVFLSTEQISNNEKILPSNEELGIVSSSIAHELNNPLAGILAALSLLELEEEIQDDVQEAISEMKNGTKRCKDLVETFLGFSKLKPIQTYHLTPPKKSSEFVSNALEQAMNLVRFRLIENNIKLTLKHQLEDVFPHQLNSSILSMVFYLILGELVTAISHYQLISDNVDLTIKGEMIERRDGIVLSIPDKYDYYQRIRTSKLISHLTDYLGLSLHFTDVLTISSKDKQLNFKGDS
ncbi:MAG: HAMP domain-containing histidine kinase [Bacteriovoracaceae bacterium]|nr:HAMP domain-containing histidine kinase [Bacteriovoracaceae bacterium]